MKNYNTIDELIEQDEIQFLSFMAGRTGPRETFSHSGATIAYYREHPEAFQKAYGHIISTNSDELTRHVEAIISSGCNWGSFVVDGYMCHLTVTKRELKE